MTKFKSIAAAVLFSLFAVACSNNSGNNQPQESTEDKTESSASQEYQGKVAYVNTDSLLAKYDFFKDQSKELSEKVDAISKELKSKGRTFENSVADFENKVNKQLVTRAQAEQMQQDLAKRQQGLQEYSSKKQDEIAELEVVLMNNVQNNLLDFLKEYNSDKKYSMIINTGSAGPVLVADPELDITDEVVAGLNKKYAESKKIEVK